MKAENKWDKEEDYIFLKKWIECNLKTDENLGIDKRNVSQSIKLFDENRGTIKTLMEYAEALGYDVEIGFRKKEEK